MPSDARFIQKGEKGSIFINDFFFYPDYTVGF